MPPKGAGPWGEAVQHWLRHRDWSQADLARATKIEPKTISSIVRGFHTTTRMLE
jgi:transcriptional regulator with XRE-family HTH domain